MENRIGTPIELPSVEEQLLRLQAQVDQLEATVIELGEDPPRKFRAWWWPDLDPETAQDRLAKLSQWVEATLITREAVPALQPPLPGGWGPRDERWLKGCWPSHPEVLDLLTALYVAWFAAYRDPRASALAALDWQSRFRPEVVRQVTAAMAGCSEGCVRG